jgi:hypothetical protein
MRAVCRKTPPLQRLIHLRGLYHPDPEIELYRGNSGYQTSYVFHLENPVHFTRQIKATIEIGHANHLGNEISSVAYWYAEELAGADGRTPHPPAALRGARRQLGYPLRVAG